MHLRFGIVALAFKAQYLPFAKFVVKDAHAFAQGGIIGGCAGAAAGTAGATCLVALAYGLAHVAVPVFVAVAVAAAPCGHGIGKAAAARGYPFQAFFGQFFKKAAADV